jgi:glycosyltransferase involved in cell wall biosynthesis
MSSRQRSVLQVLPHPGGGGDAYLDALQPIEGYRFERAYLSPGATPIAGLPTLLRNALRVQRSAASHAILHLHGEAASALCLPGLALRPSVVTLHGLNLLRRVQGWRRQAAALNLGLIVRAASRTICVSRAEHAELAQAVGERLARKALVIHNGVRPVAAPSPQERAGARAELGISPGAVVGAYAGVLEAHKDPLTPVRAALGIGQAQGGFALLVAGDGPLRPRIAAAAGANGAGTIRLLGERRDVRRILAAADFFVLASRREGLSFALLEAMALGLAVVVSDAPGNLEAVGDAGIVVPAGEIAAFGAAFARLCSDAAERAALGERARARVARSFRAEDMVRQTREVYEQIVRGRA